MANFISSAFTFTISFANDLKAALAKNPNLDIDEFTKPYFGIPAGVTQVVDAKVTQTKAKAKAKGPKDDSKPMCTAVTAKGSQCSKCAVNGGPFCTIHSKKKDGAVTKTKTKKETKVVPKHSHPPNKKKADEPCELCDNHGDVVKPDDTEKYEVMSESGVTTGSDHGDPDFALEDEDFVD